MRTSATVVGIVAIGWVATVNAQDACANLKSLMLRDTTITLAETVGAGNFRVGPAGGSSLSFALPAYCRVSGSIRPTVDSDIRFEVWLPTSAWNHRYQQVGNGGYAGNIPRFAMMQALLRGSATAGTDDGHVGAPFDATWAIGHPEKLIDFGYRAVHQTARVAKAILRTYYGEMARHAYFIGCSDGGRESLMEAQRYPQDFDGYLAGAPILDIPGDHLALLHFKWTLSALGRDGQFTPTQLKALSARVLGRCDTERASDGVLPDPRTCPFNPKELICRGTPGGSCVTAAQAAAAQSIYNGPMDPSTGARLVPGWIGTLGTEWVSWPELRQLVSGMSHAPDPLNALVYGKRAPDTGTISMVQLIRDVRSSSVGSIVNSNNPDLRAARSAGRKILQFHGWADTEVAPEFSVDYFDAVRRFLRSDTGDFYRLFMVPGMDHCGGGLGPTTVGGIAPAPVPQDPEHDWVSALEHWVEDSVAPERMIATEFKLERAAGGFLPPGAPIKRTRPLCPFPQVAIYTGAGNASDAASFRCEAVSARQ
jgi:hypothetical protein